MGVLGLLDDHLEPIKGRMGEVPLVPLSFLDMGSIGRLD